MLDYRKACFDPAALPGFTRVPGVPREDWAYDAGADAPASRRHFVFVQEAVLALNVALATQRPLLVSGEPGSGKTSLAWFAARTMGRAFYRHTITSRTQATELLSSFDALQRLGDAQTGLGVKPAQAYVRPGPLWWALNPRTARQRGRAAVPEADALEDPALTPDTGTGVVLLLDEIDKADPDVPNDLLEVLDERCFTVAETGDRIEPERHDLLLVLTTNGERELPPAFLRRCVSFRLPDPDQPWLQELARRRFGAGDGLFEESLYERLAGEVMRRREDALAQGRRPPSTSEFIDAVLACRSLLPEQWAQADPAALSALLDDVLAKASDAGASDDA